VVDYFNGQFQNGFLQTLGDEPEQARFA